MDDTSPIVSRQATRGAYRHCRAVARGHYENFPVASLALPRRLRNATAAIYAFARRADDLADEGTLGDAERLTALDDMADALTQAAHGHPPDDAVFVALADAIDRHDLPTEPFHDLLAAFRMDVQKRRYETFGELMGYCRLSANPVGRLMLALFDAATERNIGYSDAICSALQLANLLQDIEADYHQRGRLYMPREDLERFGVTEAHFRERIDDARLRRLLRFEAERTRRLLQAGSPLGVELSGRAGLEVRAIVLGGTRILSHLCDDRRPPFDRPKLGLRDAVWIIVHAATRGVFQHRRG